MVFVFLTHPEFLDSQSMPRFAAMLSEGMIDKGYTVEVLTAKPVFFKLPLPKSLRKWMGYIDQYLLFPFQLKRKVKNAPSNTLYILTDQALGPWAPWVVNKAHVVHCHDFLAQKSALDLFPQNKTGWTGKQYQAFIRRGYSKARNFISVSKKTQADLHEFLGCTPELSEVVYNGLNQLFTVHDATQCREVLSAYTGIDLSGGYILHVGGNQWYKNRPGVIKIYNAWRKQSNLNLPLLLMGQPPSATVIEAYSSSGYKNDIHLLTGVEDEMIRKAYSGASVFLFPSIAEGFGWPIVEAMASGCPVITTDDIPMTEVAGDAALLIPVMPYNVNEQDTWATNAAKVLEGLIGLKTEERKTIIDKGVLNAQQFNKNTALNKIESIYLKIVEDYSAKE